MKVLTFMEVLGVRIDIKGYSLFVPKFIRGALNRFSDEKAIPKTDATVICMFDTNDKMKLMLYNKETFVDFVEFDSLFDGKDIADIEI